VENIKGYKFDEDDIKQAIEELVNHKFLKWQNKN
jgi:hypothetical protein